MIYHPEASCYYHPLLKDWFHIPNQSYIPHILKTHDGSELLVCSSPLEHTERNKWLLFKSPSDTYLEPNIKIHPFFEKKIWELRDRSDTVEKEYLELEENYEKTTNDMNYHFVTIYNHFRNTYYNPITNEETEKPIIVLHYVDIIPEFIEKKIITNNTFISLMTHPKKMDISEIPI